MKINMRDFKNHKKGFTLIELLLVVVIIGILAGIVIAIINPARMQRRSKEAVLRANLDKICVALFNCGTLTGDPSSCDTFVGGEVDADVTVLNSNGTVSSPAANAVPPYAFYSLGLSGSTVTATATLPSSASTGGSGAKSATAACSFSCSYNFTTGASTAVTPSADCY